MEIQPLNGSTIATRKGRGDTLFVYFTSLQFDWAENQHPARYDFVNTAIREDQSAVFVRDLTNSWYHCGVSEPNASAYDLANVLYPLTVRYPRIVTIGPSMGGYAAFLFGHLLRADLAIGIVPQVRIGSDFARTVSDTRFDPWFGRLDRESSTPELFALDRALPLAPHKRYHAVIGSEAWVDRQHVDLVAGRPDFEVTVAEGCGHNDVAAWCLKSGFLLSRTAGRPAAVA